jgi:hypothetical protein
MSGSDPRRPGQGAGASSQPKPNIWCISRERRGPASISRSTAYGRGVSTVAPPASIEVEDREVRGQKFGERSVRASINRCAAYESHRWTLTKPIECDRCVICRNDGVHPYVSLLSRSEPASGFLTDLVCSAVHPKTVFLSDDLSGRSRGPGTDRCRLSPADVQGARYA